jgi:hypothetical protein
LQEQALSLLISDIKNGDPTSGEIAAIIALRLILLLQQVALYP